MMVARRRQPRSGARALGGTGWATRTRLMAVPPRSLGSRISVVGGRGERELPTHPIEAAMVGLELPGHGL
jgi:hypothetical protein